MQRRLFLVITHLKLLGQIFFEIGRAEKKRLRSRWRENFFSREGGDIT